jgi:hypothetical protein
MPGIQGPKLVANIGVGRKTSAPGTKPVRRSPSEKSKRNHANVWIFGSLFHAGFATHRKLASFTGDMRRVVHARQKVRNGGSRAVFSDFVKQVR